MFFWSWLPRRRRPLFFNIALTVLTFRPRRRLNRSGSKRKEREKRAQELRPSTSVVRAVAQVADVRDVERAVVARDHDLGRKPIGPGLILPFAGFEPARDANRHALAQPAGDLGEKVILDLDPVPFGLFADLAGLAILPAFRGRERQRRDLAAVREVADLGVAPRLPIRSTRLRV